MTGNQVAYHQLFNALLVTAVTHRPTDTDHPVMCAVLRMGIVMLLNIVLDQVLNAHMTRMHHQQLHAMQSLEIAEV